MTFILPWERGKTHGKLNGGNLYEYNTSRYKEIGCENLTQRRLFLSVGT